MDILLSTDKNYIMPTGVTMKSVCVNNDVVTFHVITDDSVSERQKQQLKNVVCKPECQKVVFYQLNSDSFDDFPSLGTVKSYVTRATYYRLFIADILPKSVTKIIYLDGDVIVRSSLQTLWNTACNEYAIGAVTDMAETTHDFVRLGYERRYGYFNAGVLLINVDYWREHRLKEKFLDLITNHPERIVLHDQDVLNITLYDQKLCLPMKYNVQNGFLWKKDFNQFGDRYDEYEADVLKAIVDPVIIHFTDNKKPWHVEDCNPYSYEFMKYYKQTEWKYRPLTHCNKSKIRYFAAKFLRRLRVIHKARTDEAKYYSLDELQSLAKNRL